MAASAYLLLASGEVQESRLRARTIGAITPADLGHENGELFMTSAGGDTFLVMLAANDCPRAEDIGKSSLPVNLALRRFFPKSPFVGNVLVVKTKSADLDCAAISSKPFDLAALLGHFELAFSASDGALLGFEEA